MMRAQVFTQACLAEAELGTVRTGERLLLAPSTTTLIKLSMISLKISTRLAPEYTFFKGLWLTEK
jgi:hypothetical protein